MRPIKFRAWDRELKKMRTMDEDVDYDEPGYDEYYFATWMMFSEALSSILLESDRFILMQSTGLLDKNGKEIFEGDVVKNNEDGRIGSVRWNNSWMKWDVGAEGYWAEDAPYVNLYFEIIGNIYENPELLNPPQGK